MIFDVIVALALVIATLGAGLMAGVYFAFSTFIMRSLDQLGAVQAADAMNAINEVILQPWFMALIFGSTLLYAVLAGKNKGRCVHCTSDVGAPALKVDWHPH